MHKTVLLAEAVFALQVQPDCWYIDATFGRGGHTTAILAAKGNVIALDMDEEAISFGQDQFASEIAAGKLILLRENFSKLAEVRAAIQTRAPEINGILFDFGTSTEQLMSSQRGFSFEGNGPLDMRMDQRLGVTAADLLAALPEKHLGQMFSEFGGEPEAKIIAHAVKLWHAEHHGKQMQVQDLVKVVEHTKQMHRGHLHPATKVFQALRILVNTELDSIQTALPAAFSILSKPGRIVTIAFHEGEDRIVKTLFNTWELSHKGRHLTHQVVTPSATEVTTNPRARSAKMRVFAL